MEEVDNIIVHSLKSIDCDIEDNVVSLRQFSTELIVSSIVRCLKVIDNDIELPNTLPPAMSARFRMGTMLANRIQELGYRGDIGYQTFLYSSEGDIRKVFMFIIDKLPKESTDSKEEVLGASILLQRTIASVLQRHLASSWVPPYLRNHGISWRGRPPQWQKEGASCMKSFHSCHISRPHGLGDLSKKIPKDLQKYYSQHLDFYTNQTIDHHHTVPSVLEENTREVTAQQEWENEWNQSGLASRLTEQEYRERKRQKVQNRISNNLRQDQQKSEAVGGGSSTAQDFQQIIDSIGNPRTSDTLRTKGSRFSHTQKLMYDKDESQTLAQIGEEIPKQDTEEEQQRKKEEEVRGLQEELQKVTSSLEKLDVEIKKMVANTQQMEESIENISRDYQTKEDSYRVKKKTLDLLPDAENNITKLQAVVDSSAKRLVILAAQWETHRAPLIDQYRELKDLSSRRESEAQKKLEEITAFRAKMKDVAEETRNKDEIYNQLKSEYERMTKDVNRSAYTKRIMEIVSNIKKQKSEIDRVLVDTKMIQKDINQISGKLDRTFTVTDELIFRDAKKDESVKKAYRYLAALHESCDLLIKTVEETGVIMREIRDLEDQIELESKKKVLTNLEKITADYQEMKKENMSMMTKLKK